MYFQNAREIRQSTRRNKLTKHWKFRSNYKENYFMRVTRDLLKLNRDQLRWIVGQTLPLSSLLISHVAHSPSFLFLYRRVFSSGGLICSHLLAGSSLADFSTLKMGAIRSSETSIHIRFTRRHISEDVIHYSHFSWYLNLVSVLEHTISPKWYIYKFM
jgi:hypothetical protein